MGQCASIRDGYRYKYNILGYTLLDDMSQGTGYKFLSYVDATQWCLERYPSWGGVSSRFYVSNLPSKLTDRWGYWGTMDGWCKSDPDAFFIEELYQFTNIIKHMPSSRRCWVQGTGSQNILYGYERLCYILPLERNGNGLCATIDGSIVPMYFLPYIIGLVVLILLCVNLILWVWFRKRNKKQTKKQKYTKIQFDDEVTTTDCE
eukprot:422864_1